MNPTVTAVEWIPSEFGGEVPRYRCSNCEQLHSSPDEIRHCRVSSPGGRSNRPLMSGNATHDGSLLLPEVVVPPAESAQQQLTLEAV